MCFTVLHHVEHVTNPDVKTIFEIGAVDDELPTQERMMRMVKTVSKIWIANQVIAHVIKVATAAGRVQQVSTPADIPEMWDRGILFTSPAINRMLVDVAHPEVCWVDPNIALDNILVMIQLKDFSHVARVSLGDVGEDAPAMAEGILYHQECRMSFDTDIEQSIIYQLPDNWLDVEMAKHGLGTVC